MLGLPGFVVLAVSDYASALEQVIETTADLVGCSECGAVAVLHDQRPCAGSALGWKSGDGGVGQAGLALPTRGVPEANLDGDLTADHAAGVVD
jgi:hypothetical protein